MAASLVDENFSCQICYDGFGIEEIWTRRLSCGHNFCDYCLQKLLENGSLCSACNEDIAFESIRDIFINEDGESIELNTSTKNNVPIKKKSLAIIRLPCEDNCEEHDSPNLLKKSVNILSDSEVMKISKDFDLVKITKTKNQLSSEIVNLDDDLNELRNMHQNTKIEIEMKTESRQNKDEFFQRLTSLESTLSEANCNKKIQEARSDIHSLFENNNLCFDPSLVSRCDDLSLMSKDDAAKLTSEELAKGNVYIKMEGEKRMFAEIIISDKGIIAFKQWKNLTEIMPITNYKIVDIFDFLHSKNVVCELTHCCCDDRISVCGQIEIQGHETVRLYNFKRHDDTCMAINLQHILAAIGCDSFIHTGISFMIFKEDESFEGEVVIETGRIGYLSFTSLLKSFGLSDF